MLRLQLFGPVDLRDRKSIAVRSVLAQPKRTALLGYLAACRSGTLHRRASLVAMFWPDLDEVHARNSLSKSLHHLRRSLGEHAIEARGAEELGISPPHLWSDVGAFHAAIESSEHRRALELYERGPLMDGLSVADAPAFDEWLDRERSALQRKAGESALALATAAAHAEDFEAAAQWLRTAAQLARYDERVLARLLTALDRIGDRAGAVSAYNDFARRLAKELELEPSPETRALAAAIRARSEPASGSEEDRAPTDLSPVARPSRDADPTRLEQPAVIAKHDPVAAAPGAEDADPAVAAAPATEPVPTRRPPWSRRVSVAALIVAAALSLLAVVSSLVRPEAHAIARFDVSPVEGQAIVAGLPGVDFDLSADGTRIVYAGESPTATSQLWLRALGDREATPIRGTTGAISPVFSPDQQSVVFEVEGTIRTISLRGESVATVLTEGREPSWSPDGRMIYFARDGIEPGSVIHRILATGGEVEAVTQPIEGAQAHPMILPGGRGMLVTIRRVAGVGGGVGVVDLRRGVVRKIVDGSTGRYAVSGHILWAEANGSLMAAPFDARRLVITGLPVGLTEAASIKAGGAAQYSLSATGTLLYRAGGLATQELVWVSRAGGVEPVDPTWIGTFTTPVLSPDGSLLAVAMAGAQGSDVWIKHLDRGSEFRFTLDGTQNAPSAWTPDGHSITFWSNRDDRFRIYTKPADGSGAPVAPYRDQVEGTRGQWSPDMEWLVFRPGFVDGDILGFRPGRDSVPVPLIATPERERNPALSPDGRWLAYTSDESGKSEVYVVPFPNVGDGRWLVSNNGGIEPRWAHSGRELFYRTPRSEMVVVAVSTEPVFSPGTPRVLFIDASLYSSILSPQYDIALDDQRFLMIRQLRGDEAGRLILIQNFMAELQRLFSR